MYVTDWFRSLPLIRKMQWLLMSFILVSLTLILVAKALENSQPPNSVEETVKLGAAMRQYQEVLKTYEQTFGSTPKSPFSYIEKKRLNAIYQSLYKDPINRPF